MTPLPRPLAPRTQVPVRIVGGPFDWPTETLAALAAMTVDVYRKHGIPRTQDSTQVATCAPTK